MDSSIATGAPACTPPHKPDEIMLRELLLQLTTLLSLLEHSGTFALADAVTATQNPCPFKVDAQHLVVSLNDKHFPVTPGQAAFFRAILDAKGLWRSGPELQKSIAELEGSRIDRVHKKLPPPLKSFVQVSRGKGYR